MNETEYSENIKTFVVNNFITLRLENKRTNIYINGEYYIHCKFLLISVPIDDYKTFHEIDLIERASENLDHSLEFEEERLTRIDSETTFWGHCSNLQVWAEYDYDTRLLHRNIVVIRKC